VKSKIYKYTKIF